MWYDRFLSPFKRPSTSPPKKEVVINDLPVAGGRQSLPDYTNLFALLHDGKLLVGLDTPTQLLTALAQLAKYNADISHAVENVVTMGNTPHTIHFDNSVSAELASAAIAHLQTVEKKWYSGGMVALRGDLMRQVSIYGCTSAEAVPKFTLKGISKIVLPSPEHIEFVYDPKTEEYLPHQRVTNFSGAIAIPITVLPNLVPLNPVTYKYIAVRRENEKPYAIPPFLSALESVKIEKDMLDGFKHVIHKLGVLGFLNVLVSEPKRLPNESPEAHYARSAAYLRQQVPELEKGLSKGIVVGFKGAHEFNLEGTNANITGARELFDLVAEMKMSGLKQDPRMLGRSFSTTETYGKVILAMFTSQINSYQRAVDEFIAYVYLLELVMAGFAVKNVSVESQMPTVNDEVNDANAFGKKIENYLALYDAGVITLQQVAQALGYDSPAIAEKTSNSIPSKKKVQRAQNKLNALLPVYPYTHAGCDCGTMHLSGQPSAMEVQLHSFIDRYFGAVSKGYDKAVASISVLVAERLNSLNTGASEQEVTDAIKHTIFVNWKTEFTDKQGAVISKFVKEVHGFYRGNTDFLKQWKNFDPANPPPSVFGVLDYRTLAYYDKSDRLYLGKFITDPDTVDRVTQFIKDRYVGQNLPIGRGDTTEFRKDFATLLKGEEWKIQRIVSTTVNKMRNTAGVMYMSDAGVEKYAVMGINDRLQCAWCKSLQGKEFTVAVSKANILHLATSDPDSVDSVAPFIVGKVSPDEISTKTGEELQALGYDLPPFHCNCRDTIVAVL